jgi:signal transduction histidine kinase
MITANVLDWSCLEKGEAVCRPTSLDIRAVCESIVNILPIKDDEVETEFMVVVAPEVPMWLFLDETYLQRILMNLLSNALKFTQSGYVFLVELKERNLVATVKDSGFGIPEPFLPHLFEPFKQAQAKANTSKWEALAPRSVAALSPLQCLSPCLLTDPRHSLQLEIIPE